MFTLLTITSRVRTMLRAYNVYSIPYGIIKSDMRFDSRQIPFPFQLLQLAGAGPSHNVGNEDHHAGTYIQRRPLDTLRILTDRPINSQNVHVSSVNSASQYDAKQQAWRSTVELSITNSTDMQSEFASTFTLPAGCWIDGYALWIGNEKVPGILAEKKTATWIYQQITAIVAIPAYYTISRAIAWRSVYSFRGERDTQNQPHTAA